MICLDNNATTAMDERVVASMEDLLAGHRQWGNPSSVHGLGRAARGFVEDARRSVATCAGAEPLEVVFTSGGTEANNLAVVGACRARAEAGLPCGVLTSPLEHPSVREAARALSRQGHEWVEVQPDEVGNIDPEQLAASLESHPAVGLVSLSCAHHELGNAYDAARFAEACREATSNPWFHCDAVQAMGKRGLDFDAIGCDLMSVSSHKVHGPPGAGALIVRRGTKLAPLSFGGSQERGFRSGTENVLAIHGFGVAAALAAVEWSVRADHCAALRARLVDGLARVEGTRVYGDPAGNIGNTVLLGVEGCAGEMLLMNLDLEGIAVSTGAACNSGKVAPSAAVLALGGSQQAALEVIRISLAKDNTREDVDSLLARLPKIVRRVRGQGVEEAVE